MFFMHAWFSSYCLLSV